MSVWVFLLGAQLIDTDRWALPALRLSAPLSTDPCSGIYEAWGLIQLQIMWEGHSWTAGLSIFPTQLSPKKNGGGTFHFSTTLNAGFCQDHKSPGETEWKCSHKLLGLNLTSGQQTRCCSSAQQACLEGQVVGTVVCVYTDYNVLI